MPTHDPFQGNFGRAEHGSLACSFSLQQKLMCVQEVLFIISLIPLQAHPHCPSENILTRLKYWCRVLAITKIFAWAFSSLLGIVMPGYSGNQNDMLMSNGGRK